MSAGGGAIDAEAIVVCALCGFSFEPGGTACAERGCPLAGTGCRTLDCPRCGYAVPDERASRLARWVRCLFRGSARTQEVAFSLADLRPNQDAFVIGIEGDAALAARLTAQGLAPGVAVHLVQRVPSYVIEVGALTLALEHRVALAIRVRSAFTCGSEG
jgi:Fe2+ transport system protein FeoA